MSQQVKYDVEIKFEFISSRAEHLVEFIKDILTKVEWHYKPEMAIKINAWSVEEKE